jgi:ATP-dependent RNA helicase DDX24/MAK5
MRVAAVVGGLALQKQERVLSGYPDIVVATPGRFMELVENGEPYLSHLERLQVPCCWVSELLGCA